jgi:IS30 family transposase
MITITFDNSTGFHSYKIIEELFGEIHYFEDSHNPCKRGINENINGFLRLCFPKRTSHSYIHNGIRDVKNGFIIKIQDSQLLRNDTVRLSEQ